MSRTFGSQEGRNIFDEWFWLLVVMVAKRLDITMLEAKEFMEEVCEEAQG